MNTDDRFHPALLDMLEQHPTPTFVLDRDGCIILWNRACAALTGLAAKDLLGTRDHWLGFYRSERPCLADLVLKDCIERAPEFYTRFSDSRLAPDAIGAEIWVDLERTGRRAYLGAEAVAIVDGAGNIAGVMETIRDLTAYKDYEARLRQLAGLDALTGLANRRSFDDVMRRECRRAARSGEPLSTLMIDIDHFKQYNDSLGHAAGDLCLMAIAGAIGDNMKRGGDFAARYGGEEFAVVLPGTDEDGAEKVAETLRGAIEARAIRHPESSASPFVTASIGAASLAPTPEETPTDLLRRADRALYRAKQKGRNRVCLDDGAPLRACA